MKILIITGGSDSERKISLISAKSVKDSLEKSSYSVKLFDFKNGSGKLKHLVHNFDVVFPILHGEQGEGGELQRFLSSSKVKFVGGSWKGFKEGWYKVPFKKFCDRNHIQSSQWKIVKTKEDVLEFGFPCVFKTSNGGSSKEVAILESLVDVDKIKELLKTADCYVEKFLQGVEVTVAVLDNKALPVLEIVPPKDKWFDYRNKYSGKTKEIPFAPSISQTIQKKVQTIALSIHQKLNLGQYSRTDFIISDNAPYVLEVNTIPGLTPESLFPKAAKAAGISFTELTKRLVDGAQIRV